MIAATETADTHISEGMTFVRKQEFDSAAECFRRAIEADPGNSRAHSNLGSTMAAIGRHEDAVEAFRRAIELDPSNAQAHFNLGASLQVLGNSEEASVCFVRTIDIDPHHEEAYFFLGREHQAAGRLNEALACFLQASDLSPNEADIYTAMAGVLVRLNLQDAAAQALEKALSLNPDDAVSRANLLHWLARDCDWERLEPHRTSIPQLGVVGGHVPPFPLLALEDDPQRHRVRSEKFAANDFAQVTPLPVPARPATRPERLRIGYFSADFHDHATMHLAARMFELHDRDRFSIHGYSYGREVTGQFRDRASKAFDQFQDVKELGTWSIADLARRDGIDVAVDLKGFTEQQRLGIFNWRPAPVQVSYLGYPGTLATPFIDYLIVDRMVIPPEERGAYAESLITLPHSYQVNDDLRPAPRAGGSRTDAGLPNEGFVFCCFNNSYKLSPAEFDIWMELLKQVEDSLLWLLISPGHMESNLRKEAARRGVDPDRLVFAPWMDRERHLARVRFADLFLDTFNYNAHTTASDALWAGVPLVTKAGRGFAARVGASLLTAIGMDELITSSERDYAELALALARDPERLAAIRARLEANRTTTPLFDSELFTRHIERAYDLAYDRFLKGLAPADIVVPE